ncbi:MAG: hypothetical protein IJV97_03800 [Alphaproteobacteria bacterium]|nr:hypothetical protein [Alphaproteobacteria bacterium]
MTISATKKIGSTTSSPRTERGYSANGRNTQFVEHIDTQNNVLVRDETSGNSNQDSYYPQNSSEQDQSEFSHSTAYVQNNINALVASGVLDDTQDNYHSQHKVNVYDNNQSIIKDEELERTGRNYLKHFYEKNEHLIDVDKLV